ncbi:unnamed protein product [Bursaphelenchus xylophilus]|uniref:(pine wood nematode) hypothetical protein n=1 Tax=Bursaphelenchus xylophilus TaxID=6326 RepID=A0A7I8XI48_BURXY|nr:unnamed protein product [Bursaphelenchus xylophilus]CAG9079115.1 unnamed protein product [Bursaphelenchus xylophilus]
MDTAGTFATITRVLLMCGSMFEHPSPTDVLITTYGFDDAGKLARFFHDEGTGKINNEPVTPLRTLGLKAVTFQFLIHGDNITTKGDVELPDGRRCAVRGSDTLPSILNMSTCVTGFRFTSSDEHVYQISCQPTIFSIQTGVDGVATPENPRVPQDIETVTCDDHIALDMDGKRLVLQKNGKCQMVELSEFREGWPLKECEVEKLKVPADNKKHGPFSMRYLVNVHGCSLQDPENETNVLDDNLVDNTFVKFLTVPSKLPLNSTVESEPEHNKVAIIAGSVGGVLSFLGIIASIIGGVCFCKKGNLSSELTYPKLYQNEAEVPYFLPTKCDRPKFKDPRTDL